MKISIPFGRGMQEALIPDEVLQAVLTPAAGSESDIPFETQQATVQEALAHPIGSEPLAEMAAGKNRILIITSDHTRPVPSKVTMPLLLKEIRKGSPEAEIHILLATGMHRPTTAAEIEEKFGPDIATRETILIHESEKDEDMTFKGTLPSGGELWMNNQVDWAELVIAEGFIEPHFFAGFSGGRKAILPGIASHKTVLYNHNSKFIADPHSVQGNLEGNPLHRDMCFAAEAAKLAFILNVTINARKQVTGAFAGHREKAHLKGCEACLSHTKVDAVISDIAITSNGGYPLDQNVYQAVKGMTSGEKCVREGGVIIMNAECSDGHGGEGFFQHFAQAANPQEVKARIASVPMDQTSPDQWEAQVLARVLCHAPCIFVTAPKNKEMIEAMHMTYAPDLATAYELAKARVGENATVTVIPDGVGVIVK